MILSCFKNAKIRKVIVRYKARLEKKGYKSRWKSLQFFRTAAFFLAE